MNNYFEHQELIKRTKLLLTKKFPKALRAFDRVVGMFYAKRENGGIINYAPCKIGRKGQCDVWGVITCYYSNSPQVKIPIHFEAEFKTGKGKLNKDQIVWRDFCLSMGWLWFEVRDEHVFINDLTNKLDDMGLVWTR